MEHHSNIDEEEDDLWHVLFSLMKKHLGWKRITSPYDGTILYSPDGSIENFFGKRKSIVRYMFNNYAAGNGSPLDATLYEQMWDVVLVLLHVYEQWMHTLHGHFVLRQISNDNEIVPPLVFTRKESFLTFLYERETGKCRYDDSTPETVDQTPVPVQIPVAATTPVLHEMITTDKTPQGKHIILY